MKNLFIVLLLVGLVSTVNAQTISRWENEISAFEKQDAQRTKHQKFILFTGSSTIRRWEGIESYFPGKSILNRGFGGSHASDLLYYADRIIGNNGVKQIVIYEGDNDLASGKTVERVVDDLKKIVIHYREKYRKATISVLSIKPSPQRIQILPQIKQVNEQMKEFMSSGKRKQFIDVLSPMLKEDGSPNSDLFVLDGVHMNPKGYNLWAEVIRPYLK